MQIVAGTFIGLAVSAADHRVTAIYAAAATIMLIADALLGSKKRTDGTWPAK